LTSKVYQSIAKKSSEEAKSSIAILQKPVAVHRVLDIIELKEVYSELEKMHVDTDAIRRANFRHEQILNILNVVSNAKSARLAFG
jgi:hypothetical protein